MDETAEFDVDDMPPGYILMRQDDGMYSFVKLEPHEQEEIIEEVDNMEIEEQFIEDSGSRDSNQGYPDLSEVQTLDELEVGNIPDVIEEELSPVSFDQTATGAQIHFVEASEHTEWDTASVRVSPDPSPQKTSPYADISWKGETIPASLTPEEVELFKGKHVLRKLAEQVKRNRSKVEIFSKKNDELKKLIGKQREHMTKLGFPLKDIARFHSRRRTSRNFLRRRGPEVDDSEMKESQRIAYKQKRLQEEYNFYRKCLKAILSSHRRYKKIFVENHEKIKKGPSKTSRAFPGPGVCLVKQVPVHPEGLATSDAFSESEDENTIAEHRTMKREPRDKKPPKTYKCHHCNYSTASKRDLVPHVRHHVTPPKMYNCPECPYATPKVTQFLEHMKLHPGAKAFECDHCDYKTAHPSALKNHKSIHMAVKPYKCPLCPLRFGRSDHLRNHLRCHSNNRSYKCEECSFASKHASGLSNHIRRTHKELYRERKEAGFKDPHTKAESAESDLSASDSEDPGETTELEVDATGKISSIRTVTHHKIPHEEASDDKEISRRASSRRKVKNKVLADFTDGEEFDEALIKTEQTDDNEPSDVVGEEHDEMEEDVANEEAEGEYETIVEDAPGTYYEDLEEEDEEEDEVLDYAEQQRAASKTGSDKKKDLLSSYVIYQCVWCDYNCEMKNALLDHSSTHMMAWTFTCKACGFIAKNPSDLQSHTEDHKNAGEFDCPYCDYVTKHKLKLKSHVEMRHPAGKPMSCSHCDFTTSSKQVMKQHMMNHKAKKMWQCMLCEYQAPFRSSLKRHIRKHTGERPYCCPYCEFNATQYSHLTRHLRRHHPEEPSRLDHRPPSPFVPIF